MPMPKQPLSQWNDPAYLRVMADTLTFQRMATMRHWETLLASPPLPVVPPGNEVIQPAKPDEGEPQLPFPP